MRRETKNVLPRQFEHGTIPMYCRLVDHRDTTILLKIFVKIYSRDAYITYTASTLVVYSHEAGQTCRSTLMTYFLHASDRLQNQHRASHISYMEMIQ